ncbi:MAG TPA: hypothetical protein VEU28_00730 [Actinomycetota bacterium]|nr:hypothetical protein [Actinomycetota bacterium]
MRNTRWVLVLFVLLASACNGDADLPTAETTEEASPATPTFQLEGRVVEASGSARTTQASPSPATTATASPAETTSPTASPGQGQTETATAIEQAAPGSLALRVATFSGQDTACTFAEGDTAVVLFTRATTFEPAELTENRTFPNNLGATDVSIQGQLLDEANCVLVAGSVSIQQASEPEATASPTAGRQASTRRSPTPARRPQATPTRSATPAPTTPAATPSAPPATPTETTPAPTET